MTFKQILMTGLAAGAFISPFAFAEDAEAREYCREYTKTIRVGNHRETGYGTACQQPDGSWMIVSARGSVDPFDALRARNVVIVAQQQPVYYDYGPYYRPVTYYAPVRYYRPRQPTFFFSIGNNRGWDDRWDRRDRWDNDRRDHDDHDNGHHNGGHNRH